MKTILVMIDGQLSNIDEMGFMEEVMHLYDGTSALPSQDEFNAIVANHFHIINGDVSYEFGGVTFKSRPSKKIGDHSYVYVIDKETNFVVDEGFESLTDITDDFVFNGDAYESENYIKYVR